MSDKFKLDLFQFLAAPAHAWLWACSWLVGWTFEFGPVEDVEDEEA